MIWTYLSQIPPTAGVFALLGLLTTIWLIWDMRRSNGYRDLKGSLRGPESDEAFARAIQEWTTDRRNPLGAAADPLHYKQVSLSDKAAKGMRKANQRIVP